MQQNDSVLSTELKWRIWQLRCAWRRLRCRVPLSTQERRLAALRNCHRGRRAFVVGNGPSLAMKDLDRLRENNEISFACNKIYLAFDHTDWRPTYYAAEDNLMFEHSWDRIRDIDQSVKLFPRYAMRYVENLKQAIYYKHIYEDAYPAQPSFSHDARFGVYGGNTVVYTLLQLAAYMGIREVYLIGVDCDYATPKEQVEGKPGQPTLFRVNREQNHFHPDYLKPGELMFDPNLLRHEKSYQAARDGFERLGGNIYNATRGGRLELFPRVGFEELI